MDDQTLGICVFLSTRPMELEKVLSLSDNDAVEAGTSLGSLRDTVCLQGMRAQAEHEGKTLKALIRTLIKQDADVDPANAQVTSRGSLEKYNRMRDFDASAEPAGVSSIGRSEPHALQFCVQKHDATRLHYDFRLELDGTLKSWAIPKGPCLDPKVKRLSVHVEDHPLDYASFEGTIPEGHYGAGDVIVWDRGIWTPLGDPTESYRKGRMKFELQGEKLSGIWNLVRTHIPGKQEQWFLIKHQDSAAKPEAEYNIVEEQPHSVLSDRTLVPRARGKAAKKQP